MNQDALKFVMANNVPEDANIMGIRVVIAWKNYGTAEQLWKSRLVIQEHRYREAKAIAADSASVAISSIYLRISASVMFHGKCGQLTLLKSTLKAIVFLKACSSGYQRNYEKGFAEYSFRFFAHCMASKNEVDIGF